MNRWPLLLVVAALAALPARAQVPPEKSESTFRVVDGLELTLWASEPLFVNPTCFDIDHKGRVWVCESVNYRHKLHGRPPVRPEGDRIVILEDTKGTGRADKATTFYQSPEMLAPLGIAVAKDPVGPGYKVFVCQSPDILVFEDKDGDGKADGPPKKLLSGFGGIDHDHGVHGILIGPDLKLYFSVGDTGVKDLQSSDGKGRKWTSNNTDCRAGTIWRCNLDGTGLELIAHNFRNEYEPCVDSFGTVFVSDNDDDGSQQTRICYVMPGGNYGYRVDRKVSHWNEELPGIVPKILRTYFGSPTGMCVYEGTLLPKKYWGQLLHTDAGPGHLRCYHLTPQGAGYTVDREDMVQSSDKWFRPSDVCVAPDGSVFVADWYDPGVGGHGIGDFTRGRIYRITPKGHQGYKVPKVDLESTEGITTALDSPALSVRYMAMAKLREMAYPDAFKVVDPATRQKENVRLQARALQQLAALSVKGPRATERCNVCVIGALSKDVRMKILSLRLQHDWLKGTDFAMSFNKDVLEYQADLSSAAVRRELLLAARDADPAEARAFILELAKRYDGKDRFYLEAIGIAVGHHDKQRRDVILKDFDKEFPEWNDKVAELVWELRPPQLLPVLENRLADTKLTAAQRARIVDILAAYDDPQAGEAVLHALAGEVPAEVQARILDNLKRLLAGKWSKLKTSKELAGIIDQLLARPQTRLTALALIAAAEKPDAAAKVAAIAGDPREAQATRLAAVQALGNIPGKEALGTLQGLLLSDKEDMAFRREVAAALAASREGTLWLIEKAQLPEALRSEVARLVRNTPFQDLKAKALAAFPPPGRLDPKKLPSMASLLARKGDPARGKQLLAGSAKSDLQCLKCHTIRGTGGSVGPDLSVIGSKGSRENLFESILYPSKAIADQYVTWVIETKKGQALSGLIVEETPQQLVLRDANGKDTRLEKKDIDSREKSPTSLMPNDLLLYMTADDLTDIVEYLSSLKTPALSFDYWHIAGPFDNGTADAGLDRDFGPEKGVDLKATYPGKAGTVGWRTVKPDGHGYVDLRTFLAPENNNVVSYLYREVESPADQEVTVLLGTDDAARLWVNGKLEYTSRQHRAAVPEQDTVKVKLTKGVNRLLLKINNGDGDHGFYLTILSGQELKRVER
jgi:putative membrane-bound dehydrogenase-like protein